MKVNILFKDKRDILTIENVRKVTNASTNIPNDWIYVYTTGDILGKPRYKYPMSKILCIEVEA